jgi:hypothetical protein
LHDQLLVLFVRQRLTDQQQQIQKPYIPPELFWSCIIEKLIFRWQIGTTCSNTILGQFLPCITGTLSSLHPNSSFCGIRLWDVIRCSYSARFCYCNYYNHDDGAATCIDIETDVPYIRGGVVCVI